ncbi:ATP-binding cassette domain-containing protein [Epidermidibacterium keratini]|uniref:ABC-type quaternary amine transporter n=1 Tax=Epidermidibacterium keratini TaxID=1891644 RepID=A0A7L4YNH2_9ACTN|nr:ABC transporter ATP-binding protein [Epidermidibacterium keratini]QHC00359.1 ATP-binding cassette domain-containing protein [Epidermidibacterium keratini]
MDTAHTRSSSIVFTDATKIYPRSSAPALDRLSLTIDDGELVSLVGPSGGGKTTALMLVNRLIDLTSGTITIGDRDIAQLDAIELRRNIGYVIQGAGLFPHMSVADNIATVPKVLGWDKARIGSRVDELLELVGLDPGDYAKRYPAQLSGGQQQRVGIARALAADPPVMLMDEPFGALDPITRERVQDEFLALHHDIGKTTVFVTHDIDEAVKMSDRIAVLKPGGKLAQFGTPQDILRDPADDFVESFLGTDRGLKLLSLATVADLPRDSRSYAGWPDVSLGLSARTALSEVLAANADGVNVRDADGELVGSVSLQAFHDSHRDPAASARSET